MSQRDHRRSTEGADSSAVSTLAFSIVVPGLGHYLSGHRACGVGWCLGVVGCCAVGAVAATPVSRGVLLLVGGLLYVGNLVDAVLLARHRPN